MSDLIERQAAIERIDEALGRVIKGPCGEKILARVPSAQPERKPGKWIEDDDGWDEIIWRCSECDTVFVLIDGTPKENEYYFCPHCGADMREVDEQG